MDNVDDADIRASLAGEEGAFARLVARYQSQISAQMWRFTRDRRVLDELVQDVFVEVFLSLHRYRGKAPLLHWIRRIATRVGYRHWKHEQRARRQRELIEQESIRWPSSMERATPSEAAEVLYQVLERLAPKDRLVLTLYYFEGCSSREIAEQAGWSPTLVRVRMHRAQKRLRGMLCGMNQRIAGDE